MLDRLAIYGVPALAGLVTAAVLIGPGREQQVVGARVWGFVSEGAGSSALRVHTVLHYGGAYLSSAQDAIELTVEREGRVVGSWRGATAESGLAEAVVKFDTPLRGDSIVRVTAGGQLLAAGELGFQPAMKPTVVTPLTKNPIVVKVPRGFLAPPFPEIVEVAADTKGDAKLEMHATGAEVRELRTMTKQCVDERCRHRWQLEATANAPAARLELRVSHREGELRWEGDLPVSNGAMWLDPKSALSGELSLRAPSPHGAAFLSLFTSEGRAWGAIVPMTTADGIATARVRLDAPSGAATLAMSSDAQVLAAGWPLRPELGVIQPQALVRIADGLPLLVAAEEARYRGARRPAYGLVLAAGLFELFFLWRKNRMARSQLDAHLRATSDAATANQVGGSVPLLWLSVLAAALALAFAILAAVAAWA